MYQGLFCELGIRQCQRKIESIDPSVCLREKTIKIKSDMLGESNFISDI